MPRIRDFRGIPTRSFDGRGNFSLGLREQLVFPEIDYDKIDRLRGLEISIVTTAKTDEEGHKVLQHNRCSICGRPRGYMRRFALCRICFRERALEGQLPGVTKSSW